MNSIYNLESNTKKLIATKKDYAIWEIKPIITIIYCRFAILKIKNFIIN